MYYIDTNVILSFIFRSENWKKAEKVVEMIKGKEVSLSPITLAELKSVICRRIDEIEITELRPRIKRLNRAERCRYLFEFVIKYILQLFRIRPISDCKEVEMGNTRMNIYIKDAIDIAEHIPLKTLDLLHLAYARGGGAKYFITLDREFIEKRDNIKEKLDIEIMGEPL